MKNALSVMILLLCLSACTKYEQFPLRPVSFEIGGKKYYSAKDTRTVHGNIFNVPDPDTLHVSEAEGLLSISYIRDSDFINHDMNYISLTIEGVNSTFETGRKISFDLSDNLGRYPSVYLSPIKTSYGSDSDLYKAVKGWIEFDTINWNTKTLSGRFEFDAEMEVDNKTCTHAKDIKVENGIFENIPFTVSSTYNPAGL
jgi:hypothetical protein